MKERTHGIVGRKQDRIQKEAGMMIFGRKGKIRTLSEFRGFNIDPKDFKG